MSLLARLTLPLASAAAGVWLASNANADPLIPGVPSIPTPGGPIAGQLPSFGGPGIAGGGGPLGGGQNGAGLGGPLAVPAIPQLSPAAAGLFLCPGVGAAANVVGGVGGGYCDFAFGQEGHVHCEWGGVSIVLDVWNCWRVWRGQPDHPAHPDPDIIPDGMGVPWALLGPTPTDQWPPPGLAPAGSFEPPPPPPPPEGTGPPPGPPPEGAP